MERTDGCCLMLWFISIKLFLGEKGLFLVQLPPGIYGFGVKGALRWSINFLLSTEQTFHSRAGTAGNEHSSGEKMSIKP